MGAVGRPEEESLQADDLLPLTSLATELAAFSLGGTNVETAHQFVRRERDGIELTHPDLDGYLHDIFGQVKDSMGAVDQLALDHGGLFVHLALSEQAGLAEMQLPNLRGASASTELREMERIATQDGRSPENVTDLVRDYILWLQTKGRDSVAGRKIAERSLLLYGRPAHERAQNPGVTTVSQDSFVVGAALTYAAYRRRIESDQMARAIFPARRRMR
jgi:hypothetical protein